MLRGENIPPLRLGCFPQFGTPGIIIIIVRKATESNSSVSVTSHAARSPLPPPLLLRSCTHSHCVTSSGRLGRLRLDPPPPSVGSFVIPIICSPLPPFLGPATQKKGEETVSSLDSEEEGAKMDSFWAGEASLRSQLRRRRGGRGKRHCSTSSYASLRFARAVAAATGQHKQARLSSCQPKTRLTTITSLPAKTNWNSISRGIRPKRERG